MKYKTTNREQRLNNAIILGFSFCSIQNIERYLKPTAYTAGVYGWKADFYEMEGYSISTGYSPLNYINLSGFVDIDKYRQTKALILKKEILKLEKKLNKKNYKWQNSGSWMLCHKKILQIFDRISKKANKIAEESTAKYRK